MAGVDYKSFYSPPVGVTATGADIAARKTVKISGVGGAENPLVVIGAAANDKIYGVIVDAIAENAIGDCLQRGKIVMTAGSGGWTAGDHLSSDSAGNLIAVAANTYFCAVALETVSAAGTGMVEVNCPATWHEA